MIGNMLEKFVAKYGPKAAELLEKGEAGLGKGARSVGAMVKEAPMQSAALGGLSALGGAGIEGLMSDDQDPDQLTEEQLIELLKKKGIM